MCSAFLGLLWVYVLCLDKTASTSGINVVSEVNLDSFEFDKSTLARHKLWPESLQLIQLWSGHQKQMQLHMTLQKEVRPSWFKTYFLVSSLLYWFGLEWFQSEGHVDFILVKWDIPLVLFLNTMLVSGHIKHADYKQTCDKVFFMSGIWVNFSLILKHPSKPMCPSSKLLM